MRFQGRITAWKDDRGFGFITPDAGGREVFAHIRSFSNRQRRPVGDERVTYELGSDARGRPRGVNIAIVGDPATPRSTPEPGPGVVAFAFAGSFLVLVVAAVFAGKLPLLVLVVYLAGSGVTFLAYAFDKSAAVKGRWRTSENTLHLLGLLGGWPGAMLAQRTLRHKTRKQSFQVMYRATVVLNSAAVIWLLSPAGMRTVKSLVSVG